MELFHVRARRTRNIWIENMVYRLEGKEEGQREGRAVDGKRVPYHRATQRSCVSKESVCLKRRP